MDMKFPKFSSNPNGSALKAYIRGILWALVITLASVLIFAVLVKFAGISSTVIKPVTQAIKVVSIFLGVLIVVKSIEKHAWIHGAILGLIYTVLSFFLFSIIDGNFSITSGLLIDTLFATAIGLISALLIRFRKKV